MRIYYTAVWTRTTMDIDTGKGCGQLQPAIATSPVALSELDYHSALGWDQTMSRSTVLKDMWIIRGQNKEEHL